jgi:predicted metal-dependent hydrolase
VTFSGEHARLAPRQLSLGGETISYTIRPSARARMLRLWAGPATGLVVTAPRHRQDDLPAIERFLFRHRQWVLRQARWLAELNATAPRRWPYGETLPYRGEEQRVVITPAPRGSTVARLPERELLVQVQRPTVEAAKRALKRWYMREAARWLEARLAELGNAMGVGWRRISVRDQRSRWGSCSSTGCLSFNYKLVMAPPEVMDYVVIHELAHRLVLNHSSRFWAIVSAQCPGYKEARAWLRSEGPLLGLEL